MTRMTMKQRFLSKVALPDENGCMLWLAGTNGKGYGKFKADGGAVRAHRFAYEMWVGAIPDGLHLDHLCRVRRCVAPDHLDPVTNRVNTLRGLSPSAQSARRVDCVNGHLLAGENLRPSQTARGERGCRMCHRERQRKYRGATR